MRKGERQVVYVKGGDASAKWLFLGTLLGAGLALLYAPRNGEETRRTLQRGLWKLRAMTEEKIDELTERIGGATDRLEEAAEAAQADEAEDTLTGDYEVASEPVSASPRRELERRLAETRARRREQNELEEPLA